MLVPRFVPLAVLLATAPAAFAQTTLVVPAPTGNALADTGNIFSQLNQIATSPPPVTVQFQAGTYVWNDFGPTTPAAMSRTITGISGLTLQGAIVGGQPATRIEFEGFDPAKPGPGPHDVPLPWDAGFRIQDCSDVVVSGFEFAPKKVGSPVGTVRPLASEGELLQVVPATTANPRHRITIEISDPDMFLPVGNWVASSGSPRLFNLEVIFVTHAVGTPYERQCINKVTLYGLQNGTPLVLEENVTSTGATQLVDVYLDDSVANYNTRVAEMAQVLAASATPLTGVLSHQFGAYGVAKGFYFDECTNSSIQDCRMLSMHHPVTLENGSDHTSDGVTIAPAKSSWVVGSMRGGYGGNYGIGGNLVFRHLDVTGAFDDCIDVVSVMWTQVAYVYGARVALVGPEWHPTLNPAAPELDNGLEPGRWGSGSLAPGAEIQFWSPDLTAIKATTTIAGVGSPYAPWDPNLQDGPWNLGLSSAPAGVAVGDPVALRGNVWNAVLVEDCSFVGGKGGGVMVSGPNVTVQRCSFTNMSGPAIRTHTIYDQFAYEASLNVIGEPVFNLQIVENVIVGCNREQAPWEEWPWRHFSHWRNGIGAIDIAVETVDNSPQRRVQHVPLVPASGSNPAFAPAAGVLIQRNTITDTGRAGIRVASCRVAAIDDNTFSQIGNDNDVAPEQNSVIYLAECDTIYVINNTWVGTLPVPAPLELLRQGPNVQNLVNLANTPDLGSSSLGEW